MCVGSRLGDYREGCPDGTLLDGNQAQCPTGSTSDASGSVTGGSVTSGTGDSSSASTGSGGPTCSGTETACGSSCFNLQTSGEHCNSCDHSCGGGECIGGLCQPATLATGIKSLHSLGVDSTDAYFSADEFIRTCPKEGPCSGAALKTIADFTGLNYDGTGGLNATDGIVAYFGGTNGHASLSTCSIPGCTTPAAHGASLSGYANELDNTGIAIATQGTAETVYFYDLAGGVTALNCTSGSNCVSAGARQTHQLSAPPLAATPTHYYYQKKTSNVLGGIVRCPTSETPCATVQDITSASAGVSRLVVTTTQLFILWAGGQGGGSSIGYCPIDGCPGAGLPTVVRSSISTFADMTAFGNDVFWVDADKVRTCPSTACSAPTDLATGLTSPTNLIADDKFVYWIEGAGDNMTNGTIKRIAR